MIYRILIRDISYPGAAGRIETQCAFGFDMAMMGLKAPKKFTNQRAKFYFSERGWDLFGRELVKRAKERGQNVKVIRKNQPKRSDVAYYDQYQLAILPRKRK